MIDTFSLALSHVLMFVAAWRLVARPDLDVDGADPADGKADIFGRKRGGGEDSARA